MNISSVTSGVVATAPGGGTQGISQAVPTASGVTEKNASPQVPSAHQVVQAVKQLNEAFVQKGQNLYASVENDKASGINIVKFTDSTTHEVVGQYPSKAVVAMADTIGQSKSGSGQLINISA